MKKLVGLLALVMCFSIAVFATTTAIPKFDKAAVISKQNADAVKTVTVAAATSPDRTRDTGQDSPNQRHTKICQYQASVQPVKPGYT